MGPGARRAERCRSIAKVKIEITKVILDVEITALPRKSGDVTRREESLCEESFFFFLGRTRKDGR
jgi:hypothetical protein